MKSPGVAGSSGSLPETGGGGFRAQAITPGWSHSGFVVDSIEKMRTRVRIPGGEFPG